MKNCITICLLVSSIGTYATNQQAIDILPYITGTGRDANGQTGFHILADNIANDDLTISIRVFDLANKLPEEILKWKDKIKTFNTLALLSKDLATIAAIAQVVEFSEIKDNNGKTAQDIFEESIEQDGNAIHPRKKALMDMLNGKDRTEENNQE